MKFNFSKCKIMHVGRAYREKCMKWGKTPAKIPKEKDLGVEINSKLSSSDQVMEARKKALKMLGVIKRNAEYKSAEVVTKLYRAFVSPHLE